MDGLLERVSMTARRHRFDSQNPNEERAKLCAEFGLDAWMTARRDRAALHVDFQKYSDTFLFADVEFKPNRSLARDQIKLTMDGNEFRTLRLSEISEALRP